MDSHTQAALDTVAGGVREPEGALRLGVALGRGFAIPLDGGLAVLPDSRSRVIAPAEADLRGGVVVLGRLAIPMHGFGRVALNADALIKPPGQVRLRAHVFELGGAQQLVQRLLFFRLRFLGPILVR